MQVALDKRSERREREHATARASILAAARRVAAREGAHGLTLRGVAAEAGYAPAALYGYFRNRSDLILALAAEDLAALARTMRDTAKASGERTPSRAATAALEQLRTSETMAAAIAALDPTSAFSEAERMFNGRLIGALKSLSDATGHASETRDGQCDVVLIAATIAGLALFARSGRLDALGYPADELLERLDRLYARSV